jgi:ABC-type sulfate transport system substrate-binding protein
MTTRRHLIQALAATALTASAFSAKVHFSDGGTFDQIYTRK